MPRKILTTKKTHPNANKLFTKMFSPVKYLMGAITKPDYSQRFPILCKNHMAIKLLREEQLPYEMFQPLMDMVNMVITINTLFFTSGLEDAYNARDSIKNIGQRFLQSKKFKATEEELDTLVKIVFMHEIQLETCTVYEMEQAYDRMMQQLNTGEGVIKINQIN